MERVRGLELLADPATTGSIRWYFLTRAAGAAAPEEIAEHFAPEFRWGWGSPRDQDALRIWFDRWHDTDTTIEEVRELEPFRFLVTTRLDGGATAKVGFILERESPHRILDTTTGTLDLTVATALESATEMTATRNEGGAGAYQSIFHPGYTTPMGPFGGYVAAMALRAGGAHTTKPLPQSMSLHFLRVAEVGPLSVVAKTLRTSSRLESVRVELEQGGRTLAEALIWAAAESPPAEGHQGAQGSLSPVPPPDSEADPVPARPAEPGIWGALEVHPVGAGPSVDAEESGEAHNWARLRPVARSGDPWVDAAGLLLALDLTAIDAVASQQRGGPAAAFTTLELSVAFYNHPCSSDWVRCHARAEATSSGVGTATATLWSAASDLLGVATVQLLRRGK